MKIGIFSGGTSVRSINIFTDISRYPTGKHEINNGYFQNIDEFSVGRLYIKFYDNVKAIYDVILQLIYI